MKIIILNNEVLPLKNSEFLQLEKIGQIFSYQNTPDHLCAERIGDGEIVFTDSCKITETVIDRCPNLRYIGILASGCNSVDMDYARKKGITVCNVPGYAAKTVSQHGFALLLHLCSHVDKFTPSVAKGLWDRDPEFLSTEHPQMELWGKTMGIIGFGPIGRSMATIALAFGMKVLVFSKYPDPFFEKSGIEFVPLNRLFKESDIISLNCPLDESRRRMINGDTINRMKDGVILINTARGGLIDEPALAEALNCGKVAAAGLDVLTEEPPAENCPLIGLPNCVITPHIGYNSEEAKERLLHISIEQLKKFLGDVL